MHIVLRGGEEGGRAGKEGGSGAGAEIRVRKTGRVYEGEMARDMTMVGCGGM